MPDFGPYMEDHWKKRKFLLEKKKLERELEVNERMVALLPPDDPWTAAARQALELLRELNTQDIAELREMYDIDKDPDDNELDSYSEELADLDFQFSELEGTIEDMKAADPSLDTRASMEALTETYHTKLEELNRKYGK